MKPLAVMLFFSLIAHVGYTQCADTFEITSIEQATPDRQDGKITVRISASGSYTYELISYVNANRTKVEEEVGSGSGTIVFENLRNDTFYRINFRFHDADHIRCRERVSERIMLNGNGR